MFDAEVTTLYGGLSMLQQANQQIGLVAQLTKSFSNCRDPENLEHTLPSLVPQRVFGATCGYENLRPSNSIARRIIFADFT